MSHVDEATLREQAKQGFATKDPMEPSKGLILHHHDQSPFGPIIEMPAKRHDNANPRQHPLRQRARCWFAAGPACRFQRLATSVLDGQGTRRTSATRIVSLMKAETIKRLQALFAESPILFAGEGAGDHEIDSAESAIGASFVPDYRWFLRKYGGAMVKSLPVYGLRWSKVMAETSVVEVTQWYRKKGWKLTDELVVISDDGSGNPIGIAKDGRVWISDLDVGADTVIASSFEEFIVGILDGRIM